MKGTNPLDQPFMTNESGEKRAKDMAVNTKTMSEMSEDPESANAEERIKAQKKFIAKLKGEMPYLVTFKNGTEQHCNESIGLAYKKQLEKQGKKSKVESVELVRPDKVESK